MDFTTSILVFFLLLALMAFSYLAGWSSATNFLRKKKIVTGKKGTYTFTPNGEMR